MKRWIGGVSVVGIAVLVASNANAGELLDTCTNILTKPSTEEQFDAILVCMEKLATEVEARPELPSGAVIAFDGSCPSSGWELYDRAGGRFLVGAGHHANTDQNGNQLRIYEKHRLNGGEETHTLTEPEMPKHSHQFNGTPVSRGGNGGTGRVLAVGDGANYQNYTPTGSIANAGKGQDHNNMPPYISVYFCMKK